MAEKKFDYNAVSNVYNSMKSINGKIEELFTKTDSEVKNKVDVCDEAIYGDLGNQLLLSWDNISSSFPAFVSNFENWSALIAKAAGDYSQFEADVAGFKNVNPLGVTSNGATQGAVATSSYNNSLTSQEISDIDVATVFYEPTGATYIDTGMVEYAKKHKTMNIITDALNVASIVLSVVQVGSVVKAASSVVNAGVTTTSSTALTVVSQTGDDLVVAGASTLDDVAVAGASTIDDVVVAGTSTIDDVVVAGTSTIDDAAGAAVKAGMSYTDDISGEAIKSVASKGGKIYTQPQQIYDDVVNGTLDSNEGVRLANRMFKDAGNLTDGGAGHKWMADISNVGKGGGTTIANTAKAGGSTASTTTQTATNAASNMDDVATNAASNMDDVATNAAKGTTFRQKVTGTYDKAKTVFNNTRDRITGSNAYKHAKDGLHNGYEYVKDLNSAMPDYAGKYAGVASGVNVVNIVTDDQSEYDPNVYSNQSNEQDESVNN